MSKPLGISGKITRAFQSSEITPLLALVGLLLGVFAVLVTPREEEPQINVTFANVFIAFPGATAKEVEELVSIPAEQILSEIEGLKHVYSVSRPGLSILTVQFRVGEDRTQAIVRLYNAIYSKQDWFPESAGVSQPIIKPKGIDDVPIVSLTLWSEDPQIGSYELKRVAHATEVELKRVKGSRDIYTLGGPDDVLHVLLDIHAMAAYKLDMAMLRKALQLNNIARSSGAIVNNNQHIVVQVGQFLSEPEDVANLVVAVHDNKPVYLRDVAVIKRGADQAEQYAWFGTGPAAATKQINVQGEYPAVTIAIAKQPGSNAVEIANEVIKRIEQLKGIVIPDNVHVTVTRNYGETANAKAKHLISKLFFATISVVLLVLLALGKHEALIVGTAVVVTLAMTLFASWVWGFTLNRVSLFALIFSIGILVDDAIVVVENIHRHLQMGEKNLLEAIPVAVDEVGGPTILATVTVIAALLPMAFVSGLMGPYMSPIPINASIGMLISLVVAFVVTPWLANKIYSRQLSTLTTGHHDDKAGLYAFFQKYVGMFLEKKAGQSRRNKLWLTIVVLIILSVSLVGFKMVVLKMLPFDNKSEFQVVVDMPEGTALETTAKVMGELGRYLSSVAEVSDYQVYAGGASPINFNGLIRQYYLREAAELGDIQVNLVDKSERERQSHDIALAVREPLQNIAAKYNANIKVVEVPPGPPVMSPLVAEIYGPTYAGQIQIAKQVRSVFEQTTDTVDIDDSVVVSAPKLIVKIDFSKAALLGISQSDVVSALSIALNGEDVTYLHTGNVKFALPIRVELPAEQKNNIEDILSIRIKNTSGEFIYLSELIKVIKTQREQTIYHKDLLPVVYVTGDIVGELDSPLYGMFDIFSELGAKANKTAGIEQKLVNLPDNPYNYSLKWDGEWQITYETFRDMGLAYSVGLIMIYLLVVAQFRSYIVPLIIMAPIPLTIIGVMPGHALAGAQFTATSMIGMIALAGIIVRNSILLVDFINQQLSEGVKLEEAVIRSGAVRAKPILLTGLAAMLGAFFILDDPIFNGLAITLISGISVSTVLTLVVIPIMYYAYMSKRKIPQAATVND